VDNEIDKLAAAALFFGCLAMQEAPTTVIIQRYLDALPGDQAAEPLIRELLERAVGRLRMLCATFLYKSYPRLTPPPLNLETDELLRGVVADYLQPCKLRAPRRPREHALFEIMARGVSASTPATSGIVP
jgi:hypothetical protein